MRKVNLVNPKTILSFEEAFSMDLAEQVGLLAPKCKLVKFILNNQYMGVYYYWEQVDESLLRRNMRMPGSIYSDNGAVIWKKSKAWKKVASRTAEQKLFRGDIEQFIEAINNPSLQDYYYYVKKHLNIEKYS